MDSDTRTAETADGRVQRSRKTRRAIVDALRALHVDGELAPTVAQLAERAGVSRRTVWQHFADLEELFVEAGRRDYEIASSLSEPVDADQPLDTRIALFTAQRATLLETMTPSWRAGRLQEPFSAQIRRNKELLVAAGRADVERLFAAELATFPARLRPEVVAAIVVAAGWPAWDSYRTDCALTPAGARAAVARTITALLADAATPRTASLRTAATPATRGRNSRR